MIELVRSFARVLLGARQRAATGRSLIGRLSNAHDAGIEEKRSNEQSRPSKCFSVGSCATAPNRTQQHVRGSLLHFINQNTGSL